MPPFLVIILIISLSTAVNGGSAKNIRKNSGKFMLVETLERSKNDNLKYLVVDKKDGKRSLIEVLKAPKRTINQNRKGGITLSESF